MSSDFRIPKKRYKVWLIERPMTAMQFIEELEICISNAMVYYQTYRLDKKNGKLESLNRLQLLYETMLLVRLPRLVQRNLSGRFRSRVIKEVCNKLKANDPYFMEETNRHFSILHNEELPSVKLSKIDSNMLWRIVDGVIDDPNRYHCKYTRRHKLAQADDFSR